MPEQVYGPYPQDPIPMNLGLQTVKLFGQHLAQVSSGSNGCVTWSTHYGPICVAVQFKGPNHLTPWTGQISGDTTKTSPPFSDVLKMESWLEEELINLRTQLLSDIPEKGSPELRRDRNVQNLPPTPKLFGSDMDVDGTQSKLMWFKKYHFATAVVVYDHCLPENCWSAELQQMNNTSTMSRLIRVEEVQTWLELELVNARNKIAAAIPPTYEDAATEVIPELLGMPMTWEVFIGPKGSWTLKGVEELCHIRLQETPDGYIPLLGLPKFEPTNLEVACKQLESVLGGLYEIIDLSVVQQKPGEAAKLFSKKSAWLPLPEKPLELPQFLIECESRDKKYPPLKMLCARHESGGWLVGTRLCTTWKCVLNEGTSYAPIPE